MSFLGQTLPWPERMTAPRSAVSGARFFATLLRIWVALVAASQRLLSAKGGRAASKRLRVVDKVLLGDKHFVALLELDGKTFLASGGQGVPMSLAPSETLVRAKKPRAVKGGESPVRKAERKAAQGVGVRASRAEPGSESAARGKSPRASGAAARRKGGDEALARSTRAPGAGPGSGKSAAGAVRRKTAEDRAAQMRVIGRTAQKGAVGVPSRKKARLPEANGPEGTRVASATPEKEAKRLVGQKGEPRGKDANAAGGGATRIPRKSGTDAPRPKKAARTEAVPFDTQEPTGAQAARVVLDAHGPATAAGNTERSFAAHGPTASSSVAQKRSSVDGGVLEQARNFESFPGPASSPGSNGRMRQPAAAEPAIRAERGQVPAAGSSGGEKKQGAREGLPDAPASMGQPSGLSGKPAAAKLEPSAEPSAETAFAALLELRMLASEVFGEIEAHGESAPPVSREVGRESEVVEARRKGAGNSVSHRFRRRLSAFACFLALVFVPHEKARAAVLPGALGTPTALAAWSAPLGSVSWGGTRGVLAAAVAPGGGVAAVDLLAAVRAPRGDEIRISGLGGSSASWSIVVVLTLLTLIPSLLFCITPFARLLIVFHFLRQALGLQTTPSNQTLIGLSLILTFFLMQPTGAVIYRDAIVPAQAGAITPLDAVVRAGGPMRHFMAHYVREKDAELFLEIAKEPRPHTVEDMSFRVLLPAYILSELKAGFQIGTVLFLPFLIVDMVVASITTSVGMMQLPPVVISTPLKLLLFLMVDGWHLLISALMRSFN